MERSSDILNEIKRNDGITVPENYFADFAARLSETLPDQTPAQEAAAAPRTTWMRIRPYAYMAAMFAGVWCMLKLFTLFTAPASDISIDRYPALAEALNNEDFVNEVVYNEMDHQEFTEGLIQQDLDFTSIPLPDSIITDYDYSSYSSLEYDDYELPTK
ncbi:MAG: hypothetical protein K2M79_02375 [Muribaculaceae bacterium]|nr:hypothetical protein [Muribaculaceae bacterium]